LLLVESKSGAFTPFYNPTRVALVAESKSDKPKE